MTASLGEDPGGQSGESPEGSFRAPSAEHLISIATYKRPVELNRLLDSIKAATVDESVDIVVVDNEGSDRTEQIVRGFGYCYVRELRPGIAQARNAGLELFTAQYESITFVDDDEWVTPGWFSALIGYSKSSGVGVVTGPVITVLPPHAPAWIRRGGFLQRPVVASGTRLLSAATNNTMLRRTAWVSAGMPQFDPTFSTTGGSDWDFFWGIRKSGIVIEWCESAVVHEDAPRNRLNLRWITQRSTRSGIVSIRVLKKHSEPLGRPLVRGMARMIYNALELAGGFLRGSGLQAKPYTAMMFEVGKFSGLFGHRIHEYSRTDGTASDES